MVCVQVALAAGERLAQFREHRLNRGKSESDLSEPRDDLRLPSAVDASPDVPLEAMHSQPAVIPVVAALRCSAAARIVLALSSSPMSVTWAARGQFRTPWEGTRVQDPAGPARV